MRQTSNLKSLIGVQMFRDFGFSREYFPTIAEYGVPFDAYAFVENIAKTVEIKYSPSGYPPHFYHLDFDYAFIVLSGRAYWIPRLILKTRISRWKTSDNVQGFRETSQLQMSKSELRPFEVTNEVLMLRKERGKRKA